MGLRQLRNINALFNVSNTKGLALNTTSYAIMLHIIMHGIQIICITYANALFLSTYTRDLLPYFFVVQGILTSIILFGISPLLDKKPRFYSMGLQVAFLLLIAASGYSLHIYYYGPFVFSFILISLSIIGSLIAWNSVLLAFNVIDFKIISPRITTYGIGADIFFGFLVTLLVKTIGPSILMYLLILFMIFSIFALLGLKPINIVVKQTKQHIVPMRYPLYRMLFIATFFISICFTLIDFSLKLKLGTIFNFKQIGEFMGLFIGVINIIALIANLIGTKPLMKRYGVTGLLLTMPIACIFTGLIVAFNPSLWAIATMAAVSYLSYFGSVNLGRELVISIFPQSIRTKGQFRLKTIAAPIATIMSAIFLSKHYVEIPTLALIIVGISIPICFYLMHLNDCYLSTLQEEVKLKRFNINDQTGENQTKAIQDTVLNALDSADDNMVFFGFSLFPSVKFTRLPQQVVRHINSENLDIRKAVIENIEKYQEKGAVPLLLERLTKEDNPTVNACLLEALATLDPSSVLDIARLELSDTIPITSTASIRILLSAGNEDDKTKAIDTLNKMIVHPQQQVRAATAQCLGDIDIINLKEKLAKLINDDDIVSSTAIEAAAKHELFQLGPQIIQRVTKSSIYARIPKSLTLLCEPHIDEITKQVLLVQTDIHLKVDDLIRILVNIGSEPAENALLQIIPAAETLLKNLIAKELAYHACRHVISREFSTKALEFALQEKKLVLALLELSNKYDNDVIKREISARLIMAKQRFLYWLAIFTQANEIISLIPTILGTNHIEQAKAVEYLNSLVNDLEVTAATLEIFFPEQQKNHLPTLPEIDRYLDNWLRSVIDFTHSNRMGDIMQNMQKVFILRSVELFKQLTGETLMIIAEETRVVDMLAGQVIFHENDPPTGLYMIVSGTVDIIRANKVVSQLKSPESFGELALLDNAPRSASAVAKTEGVLLFLEKDTFERITDDLPEVLRAVVQAVLRYLRRYMQEASQNATIPEEK